MLLRSVTIHLALVAGVAAAGCAAQPPSAEADRFALAAASLAAADAPPARDCLPPAAPLKSPGDDPWQQALGHYVRGRLLMSQQDTVTAAEELRQAAHLAPDVPRIWLNLGLARYDAGKVSAAVEALEKALALAPTDEPALYFRGRIAAARGDLVRAADCFTRLLQAAGEGTPFHMLGTYHLARVQTNLGNLGAAAVASSRFS
ncbi:MAG: tetratricopeptide repeat protein [Phycisphaerae bacterium]